MAKLSKAEKMKRQAISTKKWRDKLRLTPEGRERLAGYYNPSAERTKRQMISTKKWKAKLKLSPEGRQKLEEMKERRNKLERGRRARMKKTAEGRQEYAKFLEKRREIARIWRAKVSAEEDKVHELLGLPKKRRRKYAKKGRAPVVSGPLDGKALELHYKNLPPSYKMFDDVIWGLVKHPRRV